MNYRDSNIRRLINAISFCPTDRVPNLELLIESKHVDHILGENIGKRSWDLSPEDHVELALRTGMDAICVSALGQFAQVRKPRPDGSNMYFNGLIKTPEDLMNYPLKDEMKNTEEEIVRKVRELLYAAKWTKVGVSIIVRSVFCNSYLVMGIENFMVNLYDSPEFVEKLMDIFLDYTLGILNRVLEYPLGLVIIDDDLADSNGIMIGLQRVKKMWVTRTREITELLTRKGVPYTGHCCGNLRELMPIFIDLGYSGIHPIQPSCNNIYELKEKYKSQIALMGNIDITHPLSFNSPKDVEEDVRSHLRLLSKGGGYILSSSHSIINRIPVANYEAMLKPLHDKAF